MAGTTAIATLAASLLVGAGAPRPQVAIVPSDVLVDAPVDVRVTGLRPHERATLVATTKDYRGQTWRGTVSYVASVAGVVDTHRSGRLFTSMTGPAGSSLGPALGPTTVTIRVRARGRVVATGSFTRRGVAPGLIERDVTLGSDGFVGSYFALPGSSPGPAVLVLGGSAGGHSPYPAALLASHGYPSLSLAYFREQGLPPTLQDVPLEYFELALRWLARQPGVDPARVVVLGVSRGGEAGLLLGATYPDLVHGVIAGSPSDQVIGGLPSGSAWSLGGDPVPAGPIAVERIDGPVLAFAGGKDEVWESAAAVQRLLARARSHGRDDVVAVVYPNAGHGVIGIPNLPAPGMVEIGKQTTLELGGTPAANAAAHLDSWRRILRYLARR